MHRYALPCTLLLLTLVLSFAAQAKKPVPPDLYLMHTETGIELFRSGKFTAALVEFKEAKRVAKGWHRSTERYPQSLFNTARTYAALQDYKKTQNELSVARMAARKGLGEDSLLYAYLEVIGGKVSIEIGNNDAALNSINLAIPILSEGMEGELEAPLCDATSDVGFALFITGELKGAEEFYDEANQCFDALGLVQDVQRGSLINRLQRLYRTQEREEEADALTSQRLGSMGEAPADFGIRLLTAREATLAEASDYLDQWIADRHEDPELFDTKKILDELATGLAKQPSDEQIKGFLDRSIFAQSFSFAPTDAKPDEDYVYALPFDEETPRMVGQAFGGEKTHFSPSTYHSVDLLMLVGTPVLAAREGTVAKTIQGHTTYCYEPKDPALCSDTHGNEVVVLHDDGTFAVYAHLDSSENGIVVKQGQKVNRKQLLGHSGYTGFTSAPHLHFTVLKATTSERLRTIPYVFENGAAKDYVPKKNDMPGTPPAITGNTLLYIGEQRVESGSTPEPTYTLNNGESVQLRVEFQKVDGSVEDVTNSPHTRFVAGNPAHLSVSDDGLVTAKPMSNFTDALKEYEGKSYSELGIPLLSVYYDNGAESNFGWANLVFEIDYDGEDIIRLPKEK